MKNKKLRKKQIKRTKNFDEVNTNKTNMIINKKIDEAQFNNSNNNNTIIKNT